MNSKVLFYWHLLAFYFVGHVSYNPLVPSKNVAIIILQFVPSLLLLLLISFMTVFTVNYQYYSKRTFDRTDAIAGSIFFISEGACSVAAISQSLFHCNELLELIERFQSIERYFSKHFHMQINFSKFTRRYFEKVVIILCVFGTIVVFKITSPNIKTSTFLEVQYCLLRFFVIIPKLNALFYISFLKSFIKFANQLVRARAEHGITRNRCHIIRIMKHYKYLHYQMFTVARQISDIFGWNLVATMISTFLETTFHVFSVFSYLNTDYHNDILSVLSKYGFYF